MLKKTKMFTKPLTRAFRYILIKPLFLAIGWSYLHDLSHTFLKRLKVLWGREIACQKLFVFYRKQPNIKVVHFFIVFLTKKTLSQNISITVSQISPKLREHRRDNWTKKLPWTILEEQFPVPRYTAASKIGNSVISLLCQVQCGCNPDRNKFSSLSNTTLVVIFQIFVYGDVVYAQTWEVLTLDKLYRATLRNIAFPQRNRKNFVCELFICRFRFILFVFFSSKISRSIDGSEKYNRCVGYKKVWL